MILIGRMVATFYLSGLWIPPLINGHGPPFFAVFLGPGAALLFWVPWRSGVWGALGDTVRALFQYFV
ncbi:MAG: hypothetical protein CM15mP95_3320 [Alphaproteobacteria bacterium]|nr:MAG: hypothetical protein CM15mP95_3320 [Alphaproteobacteria bacterium]